MAGTLPPTGQSRPSLFVMIKDSPPYLHDDQLLTMTRSNILS
jgi:hypothetical protein